MRTTTPILGLSILLILSNQLAAAQEEPEVRVEVDARAVRVGEAFSIRVICQNTGKPDGPPEMNPPSGLMIRLARRNPSFSSNKIITPREVRSADAYTYDYRAVASKQGRHTIPKFTVTAGGVRYETKPVAIAAHTRRSRRGSQTKDSDYLFVELNVDPQAVYITEEVRATMRIGIRRLTYRNNRIDLIKRIDGKRTHLSIFRGESYISSEEVRIASDDEEYVYDIYRFEKTIRPEKAGFLTIGPVGVALNYPTRIGRSRDLFSFNDLAVLSQISVFDSAGEIEVEVKEPPRSGRTADYSGSIGRFEMEASATPLRVGQGEPITLTVRISGDGFLEGMAGPNLLLDKGLLAEFEVAGEEMNGVLEDRAKVFTQSIFPKQAGQKKIPSIQWSYFDTAAESYRTLRTRPVAIEVEPRSAGSGGLMTADAASITEGLTLIETGLLPNYTQIEELLASQAVSVGGGWWAFAVSCPVVYLALLTTRRRILKRRGDLGWVRRQQAAKNALGKLENAHREADDSVRILAVQRAILGYAADRCNAPPGGLTRQGAIALLTERSAEQGAIRQLDEILNRCELAGYGATSGEAGRQLLDEATDAVRRLEKDRF